MIVESTNKTISKIDNVIKIAFSLTSNLFFFLIDFLSNRICNLFGEVHIVSEYSLPSCE